MQILATEHLVVNVSPCSKIATPPLSTIIVRKKDLIPAMKKLCKSNPMNYLGKKYVISAWEDIIF
jgi:hypothetical protein